MRSTCQRHHICTQQKKRTNLLWVHAIISKSRRYHIAGYKMHHIKDENKNKDEYPRTAPAPDQATASTPFSTPSSSTFLHLLHPSGSSFHVHFALLGSESLLLFWWGRH